MVRKSRLSVFFYHRSFLYANAARPPIYLLSQVFRTPASQNTPAPLFFFLCSAVPPSLPLSPSPGPQLCRSGTTCERCEADLIRIPKSSFDLAFVKADAATRQCAGEDCAVLLCTQNNGQSNCIALYGGACRGINLRGAVSRRLASFRIRF